GRFWSARASTWLTSVIFDSFLKFGRTIDQTRRAGEAEKRKIGAAKDRQGIYEHQEDLLDNIEENSNSIYRYLA
ncbi:hypothetical protein ACCT32_37530, partial [Rhizobium brockwellii]|uniref:hypothetical protein n=1 Tax=Rhizobium brockwellii TaxID=3019932 RepID=UPI003F9525A0